jgi:hypothetical protein
MLSQTKFNHVLKDQDQYLLIKTDSLIIEWTVGECLSKLPSTLDPADYPIVVEFQGQDELYFVDAILVAEQNINNINQFVSNMMDISLAKTPFDLFNVSYKEFESYATQYMNNKYYNFDKLVFKILPREDGTELFTIDTYSYLWHPYQNGERVLESQADCHFLTLCYSATFSKYRIGTALRLGDKVSYMLNDITINQALHDKHHKPYHQASDFKYLFTNLTDTRDTFYVLEVILDKVYVVRVEPNKYLFHPYQEPSIFNWLKNLVFGK